MSDTPVEKGYEDGYSGKDYDNKDEILNPLGRLSYEVFDIVTGNTFGKLEEADKKAEAYEDGYVAGITDRENGE